MTSIHPIELLDAERLLNFVPLAAQEQFWAEFRIEVKHAYNLGYEAGYADGCDDTRPTVDKLL